MNKGLITIAVALSLVSAPALAGNKTLKNAEGDKLRIACTNSGCDVKMKKSDAKKYARVEKTKGGTKNYNLLLAKYKDLGFK